jgi:hypothetical protein
VGVIVPDADICKHWASENQIEEGWTMATLCANSRFKAAVMEQMKSAGSTAKLKGFEVVRDIHLEAELFSVENDLLTPTFKLKRPQVQSQSLSLAQLCRVSRDIPPPPPPFPHSGQDQIPEEHRRDVRPRPCNQHRMCASNHDAALAGTACSTRLRLLSPKRTRTPLTPKRLPKPISSKVNIAAGTALPCAQRLNQPILPRSARRKRAEHGAHRTQATKTRWHLLHTQHLTTRHT